METIVLILLLFVIISLRQQVKTLKRACNIYRKSDTTNRQTIAQYEVIIERYKKLLKNA